MTGGTSGTITASGSWTVSGNWDTSGAGSAFVGIASTVLLTGPGATVRISNPANGFGTLTISGSISAASGIAISGTLTISGSLDTTSANYALTISGGLTLSGANAALTTHERYPSRSIVPVGLVAHLQVDDGNPLVAGGV